MKYSNLKSLQNHVIRVSRNPDSVAPSILMENEKNNNDSDSTYYFLNQQPEITKEQVLDKHKANMM